MGLALRKLDEPSGTQEPQLRQAGYSAPSSTITSHEHAYTLGGGRPRATPYNRETDHHPSARHTATDMSLFKSNERNSPSTKTTRGLLSCSARPNIRKMQGARLYASPCLVFWELEELRKTDVQGIPPDVVLAAQTTWDREGNSSHRGRGIPYPCPVSYDARRGRQQEALMIPQQTRKR